MKSYKDYMNRIVMSKDVKNKTLDRMRAAHDGHFNLDTRQNEESVSIIDIPDVAHKPRRAWRYFAAACVLLVAGFMLKYLPQPEAPASPVTLTSPSQDTDALSPFADEFWDLGDPVTNDGSITVFIWKNEDGEIRFTLNDGEAFPSWSAYYPISFAPSLEDVDELNANIAKHPEIEKLYIRFSNDLNEEIMAIVEKIIFPIKSCPISMSNFIDIDRACDIVSEQYGADQAVGYTGEREIALYGAADTTKVYSFEVYFSDKKDGPKDICAVGLYTGNLYLYKDGEWKISKYADWEDIS